VGDFHGGVSSHKKENGILTKKKKKRATQDKLGI